MGGNPLNGNTVYYGLTRKDARALGLKYYKGRDCKRGHGAIRYTANKNCVACKQVDNQAKRENYYNYLIERGSTCEVCHQSYLSDVFDLHHVDRANKKFGVNSNWTSASRAEGDKCALLCANCHRLEHAALRLGRTTLPAGYSTPDGSTPVIDSQVGEE